MWDPRTQKLHYVDNVGRKVHTLDAEDGASRTIDMPTAITTLVLRKLGGAVVTLRTGIYFLDLANGKLDMISPLDATPAFVFNDGKVDARGRFVIGASTTNSSHPTPDGGLFRLDLDLTLTRLDSGIHYSNGPCWSPDCATLYFSDSWLNAIYAYDYDVETGAVFNRRIFANTNNLGGLPDGATVDADGLLWVALYGAGKVVAYRHDGRLERSIEMPVKFVSSVMFGGAQLDRLFVTTITHGRDGEPPEDGAGELYVIDGLGAQGLSENRFAG